MARKRDIDPGLWENEQLGSVSRDARLLFIACISQADDEGRLKGSARLLKAKAFPYDDDVTAADVTIWRDALVSAGLVCIYHVGDEELLHLPTWHKWQKLNRSFPSRIPPCPRPHNTPEVNEGAPTTHAPVSDNATSMVFSTGSGSGAGSGPETVTEPGTGPEPERAPAREAPPPPPEELQEFHSILVKLPGYDPSEEFYAKVVRSYSRLDLVDEALRMASWCQSQPRGPTRCSTGFVLKWLKKSEDERIEREKEVNGHANRNGVPAARAGVPANGRGGRDPSRPRERGRISTNPADFAGIDQG